MTIDMENTYFLDSQVMAKPKEQKGGEKIFVVRCLQMTTIIERTFNTEMANDR